MMLTSQEHTAALQLNSALRSPDLIRGNNRLFLRGIAELPLNHPNVIHSVMMSLIPTVGQVSPSISESALAMWWQYLPDTAGIDYSDFGILGGKKDGDFQLKYEAAAGKTSVTFAHGLLQFMIVMTENREQNVTATHAGKVCVRTFRQNVDRNRTLSPTGVTHVLSEYEGDQVVVRSMGLSSMAVQVSDLNQYPPFQTNYYDIRLSNEDLADSIPRGIEAIDPRRCTAVTDDRGEF